jgi:hypothetical protein
MSFFFEIKSISSEKKDKTIKTARAHKCMVEEKGGVLKVSASTEEVLHHIMTLIPRAAVTSEIRSADIIRRSCI